MDRKTLETTLVAAGWSRDEDGDLVLVNSAISLNPSGDDDDTAVCRASTRGDGRYDMRRAVSYEAAARWASTGSVT